MDLAQAKLDGSVGYMITNNFSVALGASSRTVTQMVLSHGLALAGAGIASMRFCIAESSPSSARYFAEFALQATSWATEVFDMEILVAV